ncbi:MAG: PAS domain S-box protein [Syntrophales bacterium]
MIEQPDNNQKAIGIDSPFLMRIGIVIVLALIAAILSLRLILPRVLPPTLIFEPPLLLPILNTVFLFFVSCVVSYMAMRSYLISGLPTLLLLGCGVLTLGVGALLAGWLIGPEGPNVNVTIFNVSAFISSIFHTLAAIIDLMEKPPEADPMRRRRKLMAGYLGVLVLIALLVLGAIAGIMPRFFIQGVGPTTLRQTVLAIALVLFIVSSSFKMIRFVQERARFLYWYSLALVLLAVTMVGAFLQPSVGSPMGWIGRSAQYLAGMYFLMAVFSALRDAQTRGVGLTDTIADLFHESRVYWHDILTTVSDAIVSYDEKGRILQWNQAAERIFGYPRVEVLGKSLNLILPNKHDIDPKRLGDPGLSTPGVIEMELKKGDGATFSGEVSVSTRRLSIGKVITLLIRDITGRKQAEEALRQSEERYRHLVQHAPTGIYEIDFTTGHFIEVNDAMCQILGYTRDEILAMTAFDILDDEGRARFASRIRLGRTGGRPDQAAEYPVRTKDGRLIWALLNVTFRWSGDKIVGASVIAHDITNRKWAEEELRRSRDELEMRVHERTAELEKANKTLKELSSQLLSSQEEERKRIAGEIHDTLGSCLGGIKFKVEDVLEQLGKDSNVTEKSLRNVITVIQEGIEECRRMQHDLRPSMLDDLGLLPTLSWFCRRYQTIYTGIKVDLEQTLEEGDIPDSLKVVIFRVTQEGMNNIAKHSKADLVHLSLRKMDGRIQLILEDNGQGFDLAKVLSLESTKRGLGLTSMRERTELSGGSFAIESAEGRGTTVRASWPC